MDSTSGSNVAAPKTYRSSVNWPLKAVFKTPSIWFLMAVNTGFMQALFLITSHGVLHFTDIGFSPMQAASILSLIILSSGIAGLPMGVLADRIEPRWIASVAMIAMLLMFLGLWKAPNMGFLMAVGPVFGFSYGTIGIMLTTIMGNYYGPETFPKINGVLAPIATATSAIIPVVAGVIADRTGSYDLVFIFIGFLLLGGFICAILIKPPTPKFDV
jgi:MFS family permease